MKKGLEYLEGWFARRNPERETVSLWTCSLRCRLTNRTRYFFFLPSRPLSLLFRDTLESAVRNSTRIDNTPAISRPMGSPSKETWRRKEIETPPSLPPPYGKRKKRPVPVKGMNINRGACRERLTCLPVPTFVSKNVSRAVEYIGLATK